jgi:hypothetical protein
MKNVSAQADASICQSLISAYINNLFEKNTFTYKNITLSQTQ